MRLDHGALVRHVRHPVLESERNEKIHFNPNCIWRMVPEVLVIWPKLPGTERPPTVVAELVAPCDKAGLAATMKFLRLKALNTSQRNCRLYRSEILVFFWRVALNVA